VTEKELARGAARRLSCLPILRLVPNIPKPTVSDICHCSHEPVPLRFSPMPGRFGRCHLSVQSGSDVRLPTGPIANAYLALDDFQNFALARQGADLR